jgi:hypothetical protein
MAGFVEIEGPDGTVLEFPDTMDQGAMLEAARKQFGAPPGMGQASAPGPTEPTAPEAAPALGGLRTGAKVAGAAMGGFNDSLADAVGFLPDMTAAGMRAIGLDDFAPSDPRFYRDAVRSGVRRIETLGQSGNRPEPSTRGEAVARGAGYGAGDAASFVIPGAMAAKLARAGGLAANVGRELAAAPAVQAGVGALSGGVGEASSDPGMGLAVGLAAPFGLMAAHRLVTPAASRLSALERESVKKAASLGIELTPGQATGSRPLQAMESVFGTLPMTSGPQDAIYGAQKTALNRAAMRTAGVNADNAAPATLDAAFGDIGREFDDLASRTTLTPDTRFFDDIDAIRDAYVQRLPYDIRPTVESRLDNLESVRQAFVNGQRPQIGGEAYRAISTDLRQTIRSTRSQPDVSRALSGIVSALDDLLKRSGGPELAGAWQDTRTRYRNLVNIRDSVVRTEDSRSSGEIGFGDLAKTLKQGDKAGYARGRGGELADVARVGEFLGPRIPNSGTPERTYLQSMLTGQGTGQFAALGGGSAYALGADPITGAALGALAPRLLQAAYYSPASRAYFQNQLLPGPALRPGSLAAMLAASAVGPTN